MNNGCTGKTSVVRNVEKNQSLHIAICDDETEQLEELRSYLEPLREKENLSIETYISATELMDSLEQRKLEGLNLPKIIFIDIVMQEMNGIDLAKRIRNIAPDSYLIFITAYAEYAIQGYEAKAFRYMLKPVTKGQIETVIKEIQGEINKNRKLMLKSANGEFVVNLEDIIYLCAEDKYTVLYTNDRHFVDRTSLNRYEELLGPYGFCRIHRKYIINTIYHKCITKRNVILIDGRELPISYRREKEYRKMLFREIEGEILK